MTGVAALAAVSSAVFLDRAWDEVLDDFCPDEDIISIKTKRRTEVLHIFHNHKSTIHRLLIIRIFFLVVIVVLTILICIVATCLIFETAPHNLKQYHWIVFFSRR